MQAKKIFLLRFSCLHKAKRSYVSYFSQDKLEEQSKMTFIKRVDPISAGGPDNQYLLS